MTIGERSILVAVDLPPERIDFEPVVELSLATGWPIHLLHAAAPEPVFVGYDNPGGVLDSFHRDRELADEYEQLTEHVTALAARGVTATPHVELGPTVELIRAKADEWNAAFIVIVGHKHNVAHRLVLGSVASTLLKAATRPVLVLPMPDEGSTGMAPAVDRLIDVLDREADSPELVELRAEAETELAGPVSEETSRSFRKRLQEFEVDHPSLTRAINDVSYYLSGIGL